MTSYAHIELLSIKCYVVGYKNKLWWKIPDDVPSLFFLKLHLMWDYRNIFDTVPLWHPFLGLPFPQEAEVADDAICMCEIIVYIFIEKKNGRIVKLLKKKFSVLQPWDAQLLDLLHLHLHQLGFCTSCSDCWLITDLNQMLLMHRTERSAESSSCVLLSDRSGEERLDACHHYSCRGQTTPETLLVLGENNANLITAS